MCCIVVRAELRSSTKLKWAAVDDVMFVLHGDPALPPYKGAQQPPPIFSPCLLWPNSWMDQDATWYGGRPRPWPHCVRWVPTHRPKGRSPPVFGPCLLWPNGWMDQNATWSGDIVLDGDQPPPEGHRPQFRPMSVWPNGCMD